MEVPLLVNHLLCTNTMINSMLGVQVDSDLALVKSSPLSATPGQMGKREKLICPSILYCEKMQEAFGVLLHYLEDQNHILLKI